MSKIKGKYTNVRGKYTDEEVKEFLKLSEEERVNILRKLRISERKCPPDKISAKYQCFYCNECFADMLKINLKKYRVLNLTDDEENNA